MADALATLVALLARLEDELPYVTVDDVCDRWPPSQDVGTAAGAAEGAGGGVDSDQTCRELVAQSIADRRLFTDLRQRLDPATGALQPVRLIRFNRRDPQSAALLED